MQVGSAGGGPLSQAIQLEAALIKTLKEGVDAQQRMALELIQSCSTPLAASGDVGRSLHVVA